jgi:hypothetical protein
VIAPDYPGYGFSGMPDLKPFSYTFENIMAVVEELTRKVELSEYAFDDPSHPPVYRRVS